MGWFMKSDMIISGVFILERKFLPRLGHITTCNITQPLIQFKHGLEYSLSTGTSNSTFTRRVTGSYSTVWSSWAGSSTRHYDIRCLAAGSTIVTRVWCNTGAVSRCRGGDGRAGRRQHTRRSFRRARASRALRLRRLLRCQLLNLLNHHLKRLTYFNCNYQSKYQNS